MKENKSLFGSLSSFTDDLKKQTDELNQESIEFHNSVISHLSAIEFQLNRIVVALKLKDKE